jgi:signal peptidase II
MMRSRVAVLGPARVLSVPVLVVVDQVTKWLVVRSIPLHGSIEVIPGFLSMTHVRNTGAAFGLLNAVDFPYKAAVVVLLAVVALAAIALYGSRFVSDSLAGRIGLTLVLGGAIGNLIDRASKGYVVDFVDVYWRDWHFWAFNVADASITVGACLLILDMLVLDRHASHTG